MSDYEYSDDEGDYYDDEDMMDGTQDDGESRRLKLCLSSAYSFLYRYL